jgi:endoglucanase
MRTIAQRAGIPTQRCLMSGGTCEATAYQLYGYRSAALCVALGNYHNCGPDEQIAPEFVSIDDVAGLTRLCVVAASSPELPDVEGALRTRLEEEMREYERYF